MYADYTAEQHADGEALFRRPWRFVKGVPSLEFLPDSDRPEIAFAGRSNVGKSSLINALAGRRDLARTSNTPGRTQELNFYEAPGLVLFLVDMPGYGFAKAPKAKVDAWTALVKDYLRGRPRLVRVFLLIDARRGLSPPDHDTMRLMDEAAVSYQGVLTKADKVKPEQLAHVRESVSDEFTAHAAAHARVLATSSHTGTGLLDLKAEIAGLAATYGAMA